MRRSAYVRVSCLKQIYCTIHSSRNSPFVKRWADVENQARPGQAQEQASGTMRRSGSPDHARSCNHAMAHGPPWATESRCSSSTACLPASQASQASMGVTLGPID